MSGALTRRGALARAARMGAGAGLLGLAGCGDVHRRGAEELATARSSIAIDHASFYAPIEDLRRLVQGEARRRDARVLFSADPSGAPAQQASLRRLTAADSGFRVVVVAPFDPTAVAPLLGAARGRGMDVVGLVTPVAHQSAAILVDGAGAAGLLAADAARWAGGHAGGGVLLVAPPARSPVPDPFHPYARGAAVALARAVEAAGLRVAGRVEALGAADAAPAVRGALAAHPGVRVVLTWNDATALGTAGVVRRADYVGALGAPAVTGRAALAALEGPGPLRCLVAPRLAALAEALVALPLGLLRGAAPRSTTLRAQTLVRGGAAARAARADYAA